MPKSSPRQVTLRKFSYVYIRFYILCKLTIWKWLVLYPYGSSRGKLIFIFNELEIISYFTFQLIFCLKEYE